jgi:hypothetical protein
MHKQNRAAKKKREVYNREGRYEKNKTKRHARHKKKHPNDTMPLHKNPQLQRITLKENGDEGRSN